MSQKNCINKNKISFEPSFSFLSLLIKIFPNHQSLEWVGRELKIVFIFFSQKLIYTFSFLFTNRKCHILKCNFNKIWPVGAAWVSESHSASKTKICNPFMVYVLLFYHTLLSCIIFLISFVTFDINLFLMVINGNRTP